MPCGDDDRIGSAELIQTVRRGDREARRGLDRPPFATDDSKLVPRQPEFRTLESEDLAGNAQFKRRGSVGYQGNNATSPCRHACVHQPSANVAVLNRWPPGPVANRLRRKWLVPTHADGRRLRWYRARRAGERSGTAHELQLRSVASGEHLR